MRSKKRILSLFLALLLAFSLASAAFAATPSATSGDIVILGTNDVHCATLTTIADLYAKLAAYKEAQQAIVGADNVTLVSAGDDIQGDTIGAMTKGSAIIDIMNNVGYAFAVPGNHEFDYGLDGFFNAVGWADFDYVSCNFMDLSTNQPVLEPYKMITYNNNVKVAYVGITTPETFTKSAPAYFQDANGNWIYSFCEGNNGQDLYNQVQATVNAAKAAGATYVIGVGHLGVDPADAGWQSTDVIANTTGIDAVFDGHSHTVIDGQMVANAAGKQIPLVQGGYKMADISEVVIHPDGTISAGVVSTSDLTDEDQTIHDYITNDVIAPFNDQLTAVVAHSDVNLSGFTVPGVTSSTRLIRSQETNEGDLCADAYKYVLGADIGMINGGGIRADIMAGDITYADVISVHPFGNMACLVEVSGQTMLDALEWSVHSVPSEFGSFMQFSGITFEVNPGVPSPCIIDDHGQFAGIDSSMQRRVFNVLVDGKPIDPSATYTLAGTDYTLYNAGDGYTMFNTDTVSVLQDRIMVDNMVLITYIQDNLDGNIAADSVYANPAGQGRIIIHATGVALDSSKSDLYLGRQLTLTATVAPSSASNKAVTWSTSDPKVATVDANGVVTMVSLGSATITATTADGGFTASCVVTGVNPSIATCVVTFDSSGGSAVPSQTIALGSAPVIPTNLTKDGYTFAGWYTDSSYTKAYDGSVFNTDATLYAKWIETVTPVAVPDIFTTDHIAYVNGYPDGTFRPTASLTRAEAAEAIYRLLKDDLKTGAAPAKFSDVSADSWYGAAVNTLAQMDILVGYSDGTFQPNAPITRAEMATLVSRFGENADVDATTTSYSDVSTSHWAYDAIMSATANGWLLGDGNGQFRPDSNISRAEFVTLMNRVLDRQVQTSGLLTGIITFSDVSNSSGAYTAIEEAANGHTYTRSEDGNETWATLTGGVDA